MSFLYLSPVWRGGFWGGEGVAGLPPPPQIPIYYWCAFSGVVLLFIYSRALRLGGESGVGGGGGGRLFFNFLYFFIWHLIIKKIRFDGLWLEKWMGGLMGEMVYLLFHIVIRISSLCFS